MNENKRILLLALGIMAIVASDPPVASYFERPQSACRFVADLAVSAFDSLVHSTLPLPGSETVIEHSDEILVAGPPATNEPVSVHSEATLAPSSPAESRSASVTVSLDGDVEMIETVPVLIRSACSGTAGEAIEILRVEAVMEVNAAAIEHG